MTDANGYKLKNGGAIDKARLSKLIDVYKMLSLAISKESKTWDHLCNDVAELIHGYHSEDLHLDPPICLAARSGSYAFIEKLLNAGADINARDATGRTALIIACSSNHDRAALLLINKGANIELVDDTGAKAINYSAGMTNRRPSLALIKGGADINNQDNLGNGPLLTAVKLGHLSQASLFVENGANVDLVDNQGNSALMLCLQDEAMVDLILNEANPDLSTTNKQGQNAYSLAKSVNEKIANELHQKAAAQTVLKNVSIGNEKRTVNSI